VVTEAVRRCSAVADHWEIELVPMLFLPQGDEPEPTIRGDEELLCAMVTNLVLNAIRHSPVGRPVEVGLTVADGSFRIAVRDAGPGVPADSVGQLFQPFGSLKRGGASASGTGLGLVIAKSIAEFHGGSIAYTSLPTGGCEFAICLPQLLTV
jgi:signal transduction histidine kinase